MYTWFWLGGSIKPIVGPEKLSSMFESAFFHKCVADARIFMASSTPAVLADHRKGWATMREEGWSFTELSHQEETQQSETSASEQPMEQQQELGAPGEAAASSAPAGPVQSPLCPGASALGLSGAPDVCPFSIPC